LLEEELVNQRHLAEEERLIQKRRVGALKDERRKLLEAHYVRSELAEPFETLLSDEITTAARERAETINLEWQEVAEDWSAAAEGELVGFGIQSRRGVGFETLVGPVGLEPTTYGL